MARRWVERDHPRHPGGSEQGGRFRERVGSGGWAARLNSMLGGRRGATERTVGRAGGRSDLIDVPGDRDDEQAFDDTAMVSEGVSGREMALRLEGLSDAERARRAYRGLRPGQQEGIRVHLGIESAGLGRGRDEPYMPQREVDLANEQAILDRLFPDSGTDDADEARRIMALDRAANDTPELVTGEELLRRRRLSGREVADALSPAASHFLGDRTHEEYNRMIVDEAIGAQEMNGDDVDEELDAQIELVQELRRRNKFNQWNEAVDHLRRMLTLSYLDEGDLPPLPPGRQSGTTGV